MVSGYTTMSNLVTGYTNCSACTMTCFFIIVFEKLKQGREVIWTSVAGALDRNRLSVTIRNSTCQVDSRFVSNHEFHEVMYEKAVLLSILLSRIMLCLTSLATQSLSFMAIGQHITNNPLRF